MPRLARTAQGPLGCGLYSVRLINDGVPILEARKVTSVTWGRRNQGETSTATVTIPVQGTDLRACCGNTNRIDTLRTEVEVSRNGEVVWLGWLLRDVKFTRDTIVVNAHDIMGWTERRTLKLDHVNVGVDLASIALDYLADVNGAGDLPFSIQAAATGIVGDRIVLASEDRFASEALKELFDTGLDATVVAGVLYLQPETATCGTVVLRDADFDGDIEITMDGAQRATNVIVKGANGIRAQYPLTPPDVCYHAADYVQSDDNILDQTSADAAAVDLYQRLSSSHPFFVTIPQGNSLSPRAAIHINALIPGTVVQFYSQALCMPVGQAQRLTSLDVEAAAGAESVRPFFEPVGDTEEVA